MNTHCEPTGKRHQKIAKKLKKKSNYIVLQTDTKYSKRNGLLPTPCKIIRLKQSLFNVQVKKCYLFYLKPVLIRRPEPSIR